MHRKAKAVFGTIHLFAALVVLVGVFAGLPARWAPVDLGAVVVIGLLGGSGAGLLADRPWAERAVRVTASVLLVVGLALIAVLALTASYLIGIYGPVGRGGAVILLLVAALVVPYLVALPIAELAWLGRAEKEPLTRPAPREEPAEEPATHLRAEEKIA
jgi:hypothetical protein